MEAHEDRSRALPSWPTSTVVTGALGGIGRPTMELLNELHIRIHAVDVLDSSESDAAPSSATYHRCDISRYESVQELVTGWSADELPESLVSLAGVVVSGSLVDQRPEDIRQMIDVNLIGQMFLAQAMIRRWIDEGVSGNIVFVGSWVHRVPWPGIGPYSASKAALTSIARTIAREHATSGIRCNVIAPGIVGVGMARQQWDQEPDYRSRAQRAIPLGSLQSPTSVAQGIAFLLSSWASYMTGSVLLVDGGASLYPLDDDEITGPA